MSKRMVKEQLILTPTISSIDEFLAIKGFKREEVNPEDLKAAEELIYRNRLRLQVILKQELYSKTDLKSREQLYKMICDPSELQRFGIKANETNVNVTPTIEIKSADPDITEKLKNL